MFPRKILRKNGMKLHWTVHWEIRRGKERPSYTDLQNTQANNTFQSLLNINWVEGNLILSKILPSTCGIDNAD